MTARRPTVALSCAYAKIKAVFNKTETGTQLRAGLSFFALPEGVDADRLADSLCLYLAELHKWNQAYNLTAVREPREMVPRHVFDSLSALPFVGGSRIVDIGTGAGLPGIPLALCFPHVQFTLLDANGKKTRFVQHAVNRLGLRNVTVVQARIEAFRPEPRFDAAISRAFASLQDFVAGCAHAVIPGGRLIAMKGRYPDAELAALATARTGWQVSQSTSVAVPELDGERHILVLQRSAG